MEPQIIENAWGTEGEEGIIRNTNSFLSDDGKKVLHGQPSVRKLELPNIKPMTFCTYYFLTDGYYS
jgi:hypothetical protein